MLERRPRGNGDTRPQIPGLREDMGHTSICSEFEKRVMDRSIPAQVASMMRLRAARRSGMVAVMDPSSVTAICGVG